MKDLEDLEKLLESTSRLLETVLATYVAERQYARLARRDAGDGAGDAVAKLAAVRKLLEAHGCDCDCDHAGEEHEDSCTRCFACHVDAALG